MKKLLKLFEKIAPVFEEGGKLSAFKPVYEALENFCFAPPTRNLQAPFARDPLDVKRYMSMVIVALVPCILTSFYFFGWRLVTMIVVSYAVGGTVEVIFAIVRKETINEGFLVTGMLFPLIMPPTVPLWLIAVGIAFGVFVGKELFGGTGRNIFNPALVGRCFLALAYPASMGGNWTVPGAWPMGRTLEYVTSSTADAMSSATPLVLAKQGELVELSKMFIGNISGSMGETSTLAIILGGGFLLLTRVSNWRTVVSILGSAAVIAGILHLANPDKFMPPLWHLCAGGLMFGAFYMATDPVSSPVNHASKYFYGIIIGVITMLIRNFTGYVEGVTFAILLGNISAPVIDEIVIKVRIRRLAGEG